jgi:hypothetical protein
MHNYWLKFSIEKDADGINDLLAVNTQGIEAVMVEDGYHWRIPSGTIKTTVEHNVAVKKIDQPYPSFGGRKEEDDRFFYTRISERLRHKQRAITCWDYERLVLQQFPEIYKVKAIPCDHEYSKVRLIVIPQLEKSSGIDPLQPRLPQAQLDNIQAFVNQYCSAFSSVSVLNPRYQHVKVRVSVRFKSGYNETVYRRHLNDEIKKFLSPWAFSGPHEIVFSSEVYANAVVNFLDKQESVSYVVGLKLFTSFNGEDFVFVPPTDEKNTNRVEAIAQDVILVSAEQHEIDIINDDRIDYDDLSGVGYMKIELDFKIV